MEPTYLQIVLLGLIQGAAELLPVSSSAHVIVAEKLLGLDPAHPAMTFLLVMLHTGTMFAVITYFWNSWRSNYFASIGRFGTVLANALVASFFTGVLYLGLKKGIEKVFLGGSHDKAEIESLFSNLPLIAAALVAAGLLIIVAGLRSRREYRGGTDVGLGSAAWIGIVQGFCLPFRGFSRSGATISAGTLAGVDKRRAEEFSFALAVILTPAAIAQELHRFLKANAALPEPESLGRLVAPGLVGMVCAFAAGLLALRWLSRWLEHGRWHWFGIYCLAFAAVVLALALKGGY